MAVGAVRACAEAGVRVPEDVAVIGFDGIAETRYANPSISTISPDLTHLARRALEMLVSRIDGDTSPSQEVAVPWTLVARESTTGRAAQT